MKLTSFRSTSHSLPPRGIAVHLAGQGAMTLTEVLIALAISGMVAAALLATVLSTAREARRNLADTLLEEQAGQIQDRTMRVIRSMSASEGVTFGDAYSAGLYRKIVLAAGPAPDFPRQEIYFETNSRALKYDTNRNVAGVDKTLIYLRSNATLSNVLFYPAMKLDGSLETALVNIYFELNDGGFSGRKNADGSRKYKVVKRSFAVALRNP